MIDNRTNRGKQFRLLENRRGDCCRYRLAALSERQCETHSPRRTIEELSSCRKSRFQRPIRRMSAINATINTIIKNSTILQSSEERFEVFKGKSIC